MQQAWHAHFEPKYSELVRWLAPQKYENDHYKEDLEDARSLRYPGTCRWIEVRSEYENWIRSSSSSDQSLLWISAIPGAGKTVLASYLIDSIAQKNSNSAKNIFYFFFKTTDMDKNNPMAATKALVHQLLLCDDQERFFKKLQYSMETAAHPSAINFKPIWSLFCHYCSMLRDATIILDALDECTNILYLLPGLLELAEKHKIRMVFTSRREPELVQKLAAVPVLDMGPDDVADDIDAFVEYEVSQRAVLSDLRVRPRILGILNARSKGMFLWTALMIKELDSLSSIDEVDDALCSVPENLDGVYRHILKRLHSTLKQSQRQLVARILRWIVLAKTPLHLVELKEALRIDYATSQSGFHFAQNFLCSEKELGLVCGPLVTTKSNIIQLVHLSTKEFLLCPADSSNMESPCTEFLVSFTKDSGYVAEKLVSSIFVTWRGESIEVSNESEEVSSEPEENLAAKFWRTELQSEFPLLEYACFNWLSHMVDSKPQVVRDDVENFKEFFECPQAWWYWIEFCLVLRHDCVAQLSSDLQGFLEWAGVNAESDFEYLNLDSSQPSSKARAESILGVLENFGQVLERQPNRIHSIDPALVGLPSHTQPLACKFPHRACEQHVILDSQLPLKETTLVPSNRRLRKFPCCENKYGFFCFDHRRKIFLVLDHCLTSRPQIECQDATTGRTSCPVIDSELQAYDSFKPWVIGAALSHSARYLGVAYAEATMSESGPGCTYYTAAWVLQDYIDFSRDCSVPWARKVVSAVRKSANSDIFIRSCRPIAFLGETVLCSPNGYIDLLTGNVEELPILQSDDIEQEDISSVGFSGNGNDIFNITHHGGINHITRDGNNRKVVDILPMSIERVVGISHSGRFLVWKQRFEPLSFNDKYCIIDRFSNRVSDLQVSQNQEWKGEEFKFTKDETGLVGIVKIFSEVGLRTDIHLTYWDLRNGTPAIHGVRIIAGEAAGHFLHEVENHLYIVSSKRTWARYDLGTRELRNLDTEPDVRHSHVTNYKISEDGSKLAVLRKENMS